MALTPGAGVPEVLQAGGISAWFDLRDYAGRDCALTIVIAGGAVGALEISADPAIVKSPDVVQIETYNASVVKALRSPLPSFARVRNTGGAGTVTYMFHHGINAAGQSCQICPQSQDTPRTGAFS